VLDAASVGSVSTSSDVSDSTHMFMGSKNDEQSFLYDDLGTGDHSSNELDKYMIEPLLKQSEFDILAWWKNKTEVYLILSQMTHDVMAIQVSTIASESAFSAGGRVTDPYRSRLDPEMVQTLICTKDWITASHKDNKLTIKIDFICNYRIFTCSDFVCVRAFQIQSLFHPLLWTWRF
jgi:hypothetical protein